jgi:Protein of unknown function (DUF4232)
MRNTVARAALGAALIPFLVTACGQTAKPGDSAAPAPSNSVAPSANDGSANGTDGTSVQAANGSGKKGSDGSQASQGGKGHPCTSIRPDLTVQSQGVALLAVTNTGTRSCTVNGWADVQLQGPDGGRLPAGAKRVGKPGAPVRTVLKPGQSVFAGVKWRECDKAQTNCLVASTVKVAAPGATKHVAAEFTGAAGGSQQVTTFSVQPGSLQVGSFQPSSQGVVAW